MKKWVTIVFILISNSLLAQLKERDIERYVGRITGVFSTYEQHQRDSTFDNVVVITNLIRKDDEGVYWIYTEQGEFLNYTPYRKRVYELKLVDGKILQNIYYIKNEFSFSYLNASTITLNDVYLKDGCDIEIKKNDKNIYTGKTTDDKCIATFRGSTHTTTDFIVYQNEIRSWERGWDDNGIQKWGSTKGYYIYKK
jgi:hypothetical protein